MHKAKILSLNIWGYFFYISSIWRTRNGRTAHDHRLDIDYRAQGEFSCGHFTYKSPEGCEQEDTARCSNASPLGTASYRTREPLTDGTIRLWNTSWPPEQESEKGTRWDDDIRTFLRASLLSLAGDGIRFQRRLFFVIEVTRDVCL